MRRVSVEAGAGYDPEPLLARTPQVDRLGFPGGKHAAHQLRVRRIAELAGQQILVA